MGEVPFMLVRKIRNYAPRPTRAPPAPPPPSARRFEDLAVWPPDAMRQTFVRREADAREQKQPRRPFEYRRPCCYYGRRATLATPFSLCV